MIHRCSRCWASRDLEKMFTCLDCHELFCRTHKALPGLSKCEECFESALVDLKDKEGIKRELHRISNRVLYAVPAGYTHKDVLWMLELLQRLV